MLELAMASADSDQGPAVVREDAEDFADLHAADYAPTPRGHSTRGLTCKLRGRRRAQHGGHPRTSEAPQVGGPLERGVRPQWGAALERQ